MDIVLYAYRLGASSNLRYRLDQCLIGVVGHRDIVGWKTLGCRGSKFYTEWRCGHWYIAALSLFYRISAPNSDAALDFQD